MNNSLILFCKSEICCVNVGLTSHSLVDVFSVVPVAHWDGCVSASHSLVDVFSVVPVAQVIVEPLDSHASPILSPSVSSWLAFGIVGQLSNGSTTPSLSKS